MPTLHVSRTQFCWLKTPCTCPAPPLLRLACSWLLEACIFFFLEKKRKQKKTWFGTSLRLPYLSSSVDSCQLAPLETRWKGCFLILGWRLFFSHFSIFCSFSLFISLFFLLTDTPENHITQHEWYSLQKPTYFKRQWYHCYFKENNGDRNKMDR